MLVRLAWLVRLAFAYLVAYVLVCGVRPLSHSLPELRQGRVTHRKLTLGM